METKGLTCKIPLDLHNRITEEIRQSESTMSKFIEQIILEHYTKGATTMGKTRTLAFQVSEELFQQIKDYLTRYEQVYHCRLSQKEFVIRLIEQALAEADEEFEAAQAIEDEARSCRIRNWTRERIPRRMQKAANTLPRTPSSCKTRPAPAVKTTGNFSFKGECNTIQFIDMFAGIGGFREGLSRAGGFTCVGHCECDKYAEHSYRALFDCKGEWYTEDARNADPDTMPDFDLLCGGFPCQAFSLAGNRKGFGDPRGTLFFELARLAEARKPRYLLFENVPGLLNP